MSKEKQIEEMAKTNCAYCRSIHNCSLDTCESSYEEAEHLYNEGYRKQEWISVDDRLPERYTETVLALCKDGDMFVGRYVSYKRWEIWTAMKSTRTVNRKVTHWMPLPEPPRMKGE